MLRHDKTPMPLVIVELPTTQTDNYNITTCCHLSIRVEPLRRSNQITQCYNCQQYGHSQRNCHAAPKCAGPHPSFECSKPRCTDAKCCNCTGSHTANYKGCPTYQKFQKQSPQLNIKNKINPWNSTNPSQSITPVNFNSTHFPPLKTSSTSKQKSTATVHSKPELKSEITSTLCDLILQFSTTNPNTNNMNKFISSIQKIIKLINE